MFHGHEVSVSAGLAGIGSRRDLHQALSDLTDPTCGDTSAALILVDIDFFGNFQFACGVAACDECLDTIADCLLETTRRFNARVYAFDTGRFAVLLPAANERTADRVAREIHFQVGGLVITHPRSPVSRTISVSVGLAVRPLDSPRASAEILAEAQAALQAAHAQGHDRVLRREMTACV